MTQRPQNRTNIARLGQDMLQNEDILCTKSQTHTLAHADLMDVLTGAPALVLKGVLLLREQRATGRLPEDRQRLIDATAELVAYTEACKSTAGVLRALQPIPAKQETLVEGYPL